MNSDLGSENENDRPGLEPDDKETVLHCAIYSLIPMATFRGLRMMLA